MLSLRMLDGKGCCGLVFPTAHSDGGIRSMPATFAGGLSEAARVTDVKEESTVRYEVSKRESTFGV